MQQGLIDVAKRNPIPSGAIVVLIGVWMFADAYIEGEFLSHFRGGDPADATVVRTYNAPGRPILPDFRAVVKWTSPDDTTREATIGIFKAQYENWKPGDEVVIVTSARDPAAAVLASRLENAGVFSVSGIPVAGMAVVGALMSSLGLGFAGWGLYRKLRTGDSGID